jgi:hypothetical protein
MDAGPTTVRGPAEHACHELLLRLAGRLPDELVWRLRDWLAVGAHDSLSAMLPRALLRHRVGLTDAERDLLVDAVSGWGASRRLLDSVLPAGGADERAPEFHRGPGTPDIVALTVLAVVRGHPGCVDLRQAWRADGGRRVVLVTGAEHPWRLAGTLQRVLRAQGEHTPRVEVITHSGEPSAYHRAALAASAPLWLSGGVQVVA